MESRLFLLVFMLLIIEIRGQICEIAGCNLCDGRTATCNTNQPGNIVPSTIKNSTQSITITYAGPAAILRNSMIRRFPNLAVFAISGNIDRIEDGTFAGKFLIRVDIRQTFVDKFPDDTFGENSTVTQLLLGNSNLNSIPTNIFKDLPNLESLDLSYTPIKGLCTKVNIGEEFRLLESLKSLDLSGLARFEDCTNVSDHYLEPLSHLTEELTLTDTGFFYGSQMLLKPLIKMSKLHISNLSPYKECPNIAQELIANLPIGLRSVNMSDWQTVLPLDDLCHMTKITLEGLRSLPNLVELNFAYSSGIFGMTLTASLFQGLQALTYLDFSWCQFSKIESGALDHLQLSALNLNGNQLGSRELTAFKANRTLSSSLTSLYLSNCQLSLDKSSFIYPADYIVTSFPDLLELVLSANNLHKIPHLSRPEDNHDSCSINILDMSKNNLDSLEGKELRELCMQCSWLEVLDVSDNRIVGVLDIDYCFYLRFFNLNNNLLGYGNQNENLAALQSLSELMYLDLGRNGLTHISATLFAEMEQLWSINLADNLITTLEDSTFINNIQLTILDLSSNQLSSFSTNLIGGNLSTLHLENNYIRSFPPLFIDLVEKNLTKLNFITAYGNPFDCSCGKLQFQSWVRNSTKLHSGKALKCGSPVTRQGVNVYEYEESLFDCQIKLPLIIISAIVGGIILIALVSTRCYRYRWYMSHIRVVLRAVAVAAKSAKTIDECKYDVMICVNKSSDSDVDWVITELLPQLEGGDYSTVETNIPDDRKNRVYLHMRDAVPGGYRVEVLCEAMKQSRKIIIVLSNSFLENAECMSEAVYAREELYITRTYKPARVMVIILEELREDLLLGSPVSGLLTETVIDLPQRLRTDSNTNTCTSRMNRIWKRIHKFVDKEKWIVYQKSPDEQRSQEDGHELM